MKVLSGVFVKKENKLSSSSSIIKNSANKKFLVYRDINFETVKEAFDKKLIIDLNNQTFFMRDNGTYPSLIHVAVDKKEKPLINFLLEHDINLNVVEPGQSSLLKKITCWPLYQNGYELIQKVINAGADVNDPDLWSKNCDSRLEKLININPSVAELFIKSGVNIHPSCVCKGNTINGCVPLPCAVESMNYKIINLLLKKGVDINERCKGSDSALISAIKINDIGLMNHFLDLGAFINEYYDDGVTALDIAVLRRGSQILKILLSHELINLDLQNNRYSGTVVHLAVQISASNCIDFILDANPDINLLNRNNDLAVEIPTTGNPKFQEGITKLKKHIVRLRAAGFHLHDRNLAAVSGKEYENLYAECCQQVNSMKETTITPNSHLNFHDLLFIDEKKLSLCLESLDDHGILQSGLDGTFSFYAGMIQYKLNKAFRWMKLREALSEAVNILFNHHLPAPIMEILFNYFNIYDLKKLRTYLKKYVPGKSNEYLEYHFK